MSLILLALTALPIVDSDGVSITIIIWKLLFLKNIPNFLPWKVLNLKNNHLGVSPLLVAEAVEVEEDVVMAEAVIALAEATEGMVVSNQHVMKPKAVVETDQAVDVWATPVGAAKERQVEVGARVALAELLAQDVGAGIGVITITFPTTISMI
jgi:hypothetical protein